jgi:hypothetical protein
MWVLGRGVDPVPAEWRSAEPERDRLARDLEREIEVGIHGKFDEPFDPDDDTWEQRVHIVSYPEGYEPELPPNRRYVGRLTAGWIYYNAGAWWWQPSWSAADSPRLSDLGMHQPPSVELDVETEEDAILHAKRRLAWELAD